MPYQIYPSALPVGTVRLMSPLEERERKYLWQQNTLYGMPEEMCYVLTDVLNTPIQVTDGSGRTQNAYRYDEFGVPQYRREESPLPFGFTGYLADRAEGLYYANAREYHAGSGRFLTKDLNSYMDLKDPNTLNLYQYVKGNPLKYMDYSGHESICEKRDYLERTINMAGLGNFTNDFTIAGLGIQLGLGFFGLDFPCDVRDFVADITVNRDMTSPAWYGTIVLDVVAFVPVIGEFKYADEVATGVKSIFKNGDDLIDGGKRLAEAADALGDISKKGGTALGGIADSLGELSKKAVKNADMLNDAKYVDDVADAASDVGKKLDDLADAASDAGKRFDDVIGGGLNSNMPSARIADEALDNDLLKNAHEIKDKLPTWAKEKGNFGYSEVDIKELDNTQFFAHSGIQTEIPSVKDSGISIKPESSPFKTAEVNSNNVINGEGAWPRDVDTEYKILSDIQSKLGDNHSASGKIKLYTELEPCPSCQSVISQFKEMYPNIDIEVIYSITK